MPGYLGPQLHLETPFLLGQKNISIRTLIIWIMPLVTTMPETNFILILTRHLPPTEYNLPQNNWLLGSQNPQRKGSELKLFHEIIEEIEEGEMPLTSYRIMHWDSRVTPEQLDTLKLWFNGFTKVIKTTHGFYGVALPSDL